MAMSKKHYEAVAHALRDVRFTGEYDEATLDAVIDRLAEVFGDDNPAFKAGVFGDEARTIAVGKATLMGFARLQNKDDDFEVLLERVEKNRQRAAARRAARAAEAV